MLGGAAYLSSRSRVSTANVAAAMNIVMGTTTTGQIVVVAVAIAPVAVTTPTLVAARPIRDRIERAERGGDAPGSSGATVTVGSKFT